MTRGSEEQNREMGSMRGERTMDMVNRDLSDDELAQRLHMINQHEIQMAQLAASHASSRDVKDYARRLVKDHQNADHDLMDVAKKMNINLMGQGGAGGDDMSQKAHAKLEELQSLTGADFDRHFLVDMQMGHSMATLLMTAQAYMHPAGRELREYIRKQLPIVENHRRDSIRFLEKEANRAPAAS
jgi:putative membrane protein